MNFSKHPVDPPAFSRDRFSILTPEAKSRFGLMMEIILLETSPRAAREAWQAEQLENLVRHAIDRSAYWSEAFKGVKRKTGRLGGLPAFTRDELNRQVRSEGALLSARDGVETVLHSTSGSTGHAARFHVLEPNAVYTSVRNEAQLLIYGTDPMKNALFTDYRFEIPGGARYDVTTIERRYHMHSPFMTGTNHNLRYNNDFKPEDVENVIKKNRPALLFCASYFLDMLASRMDISLLVKWGVDEYIIRAATLSQDTERKLVEAGAVLRRNYSCEEVGPIAYECASRPGAYHVCCSNAIVEKGEAVRLDGRTVHKLLITGLHSYATPFIRYWNGDLGTLADRCACGHDGPVISELIGRSAATFLRPDGTRTAFLMRGREMNAISPVAEHRAVQTARDRLDVEIVALDKEAAEAKRDRFLAYATGQTGPGVKVEIRFVEAIDWGPSPKRLQFRSEVT
jgi:phenylacetate-CoA ligase